jgi:hypothetical protein
MGGFGFAKQALVGPAGVGFLTDRQRLDPEPPQPLSAGNFPTYSKFDGTNFPISLLGYNDTTAQSMFWKCFISTYGSGNLTLKLLWYSDTGQTTGNVVWGAAISAIAPGAATNVTTAALATQDTATTAVNGNTKGLTLTTITISDLGGFVNGDLLWIQIQRVAASGSDTMTGNANLVCAELSWSTQ